MVNDTLTPLSIEETLRKQDPYGVKGLKIGWVVGVNFEKFGVCG